MASRHISVFFYGLFMDADLLRSKGAMPHNIRAASVAGFALRIGQRATMTPYAGGRVHGLLMELTQTEIDQLYLDASVRAYRPEAVLCELQDGSCIPALCFNLTEVPREANAEYAKKLRELAASVGLPSQYVDSIQ